MFKSVGLCLGARLALRAQRRWPRIIFWSLQVSLAVGDSIWSWTLNGNLQSVLRIRDVYLGSRILIFVHPGSKNNNNIEGWKKCIVLPFFVAINITKLKIILFLNWSRKNKGQLQRMVGFFPKNLSWSSQKYRFRIRDPRCGHRIPDPDPQHCL